MVTGWVSACGLIQKGVCDILVLTRQRDEIIKIGDDIEIMVVAVQDGKVRLGITAPSGVPVHRLEVYQKIHGASVGQPDLGGEG